MNSTVRANGTEVLIIINCVVSIRHDWGACQDTANVVLDFVRFFVETLEVDVVTGAVFGLVFPDARHDSCDFDLMCWFLCHGLFLQSKKAFFVCSLSADRQERLCGGTSNESVSSDGQGGLLKPSVTTSLAWV